MRTMDVTNGLNEDGVEGWLLKEGAKWNPRWRREMQRCEGCESRIRGSSIPLR